jgi:hypothetical protein
MGFMGFVFYLETNTWARPEVNGDIPLARWGHTTECVGKYLIVFGGHDGASMLNDVHLLDLGSFMIVSCCQLIFKY